MKRSSPSSISGLMSKIKMKKKSVEKLKNTLKNVLRYLSSDSHMYSPMLSDKPSSVSSSQLQVNKGGMAMKRTKRAKNKNKFLHKLVDYLKSDCYLYAPLLDYSPSMQAAPESNGASKISRPSKRAAKRPNGKNSSPRSTLVKNTLAFRREEKCLINSVGRSPSSSGGLSKGFRIPKTTTILTGKEVLKIIKDGA
ncbi:hypothetical protein ACET3Z_014741 [Daucus carota]